MTNADKIINYTGLLSATKKRWEILDQFDASERTMASDLIDSLVESGELFIVKGDNPATQESWEYTSRQPVDDMIIDGVKKGFSISKIQIRAAKDFPTEVYLIPERIRILIKAGVINEPAPEKNQEHKTDEGKPLAGCLLEFGQALEALASVATHGATRYGRGTWKRVERQRYIDALMRHVLAMGADCAALDEDSNLPHIVHVLWNAAAIIELKDTPNVEV